VKNDIYLEAAGAQPAAFLLICRQDAGGTTSTAVQTAQSTSSEQQFDLSARLCSSVYAFQIKEKERALPIRSR